MTTETVCPFCNITASVKREFNHGHHLLPATERVLLTRDRTILVCSKHADGIGRAARGLPAKPEYTAAEFLAEADRLDKEGKPNLAEQARENAAKQAGEESYRFLLPGEPVKLGDEFRYTKDEPFFLVAEQFIDGRVVMDNQIERFRRPIKKEASLQHQLTEARAEVEKLKADRDEWKRRYDEMSEDTFGDERRMLNSEIEALKRERDDHQKMRQHWCALYTAIMEAPAERDSLRAQLAAIHAASEEFRDSVLNQRHQLAENGMDNDQVNDVLGLFDDTIGAVLTHSPATEEKA